MSQLTPDETLLGLIAIHARHGYELLESFRQPEQLGRVWNLSTSQLYAVLKRLEAQGDIIGDRFTPENAPTRTEYHLSQQGETKLDRWLHEQQPSASIRQIRVEFLSRLYIARQLGFSTQPIVAAQRRVCEQKRKDLICERDSASPGIEFLTIEFMISQLDAVLGWIERCEIFPLQTD